MDSKLSQVSTFKTINRSHKEDRFRNDSPRTNIMTLSERSLTELILADLMFYRLSSVTFGIIPDSLKSLDVNLSDDWINKTRNYCRELRHKIMKQNHFLSNSDMKHYKKEVHPLCHQMADDIERNFGKQMAAMLMALLENEDQIISEDSFHQLLTGIFGTGITWNRIGFMLTLISNLPCLTKTSYSANPLMFIDWTVDFTEKRLLLWIRENSNWDGLAIYLNNKPPNEEMITNFPSKLIFFIATCGIAVCICLGANMYKVL